MKTQHLILLLSICAAIACGGGGSSSNNDSDFSSGGGSLAREAIDSYVNDFIIVTYSNLDSAVANLQSSVSALVNNSSEANLEAAQVAWVSARVYWENSEAALFGPVDFYGFDPSLDSWPVNRTDLDAVLNSSVELTAQTVSNFETTLKGFHTIEYLLWGADSNKAATALTSREKQYLVAATDELRGVSSALLAAWASGYNGQAPYSLELVNAGQGSTSYPSEAAALEQIVQGLITICDEVANGKIASPFDARNPDIVESQFSFNSIADFANNIVGARDAYQISIGNVVQASNASLDSRVVAEFNSAIVAIRRIPEPFRSAILDTSNDSTIVAAQQAVRTVLDTLQSDVLPLVTK